MGKGKKTSLFMGKKNGNYNWAYSLLLSALTILITTGCSNAQTNTKENISCEQALTLIETNSGNPSFIILDLRTPEEFILGHLENAVLIDYKSKDFRDEINKLNSENIYLVYCKGGTRSAKAISILKSIEFIYLYHLYEGIDKWQSEGFKVVAD